MANPKHLEILRRGVKIWNRWRDHHAYIKSDFYLEDSDAVANYAADLISEHPNDLHLFDNEDLSNPDLSWADLSWAKLSGVDLRGADLRGADLTAIFT